LPDNQLPKQEDQQEIKVEAAGWEDTPLEIDLDGVLEPESHLTKHEELPLTGIHEH